MIITGRTINQLPILSAITSASTLILQTGSTTFRASLSEFAKSSVFSDIYQDLIPVSSNTFAIGSTGSTIKKLYVTSGSVIVSQNGFIGIDSTGNIYSTSGISTPSLYIGQITSEGIKSSGISINIISGDTIILNSSGESINLFKQIVPTGGSISQVLSKKSNNDYDFDWQNLQAIYITGGTNLNANGTPIFLSGNPSNLFFRTISSATPEHIVLSISDNIILLSGNGLINTVNIGGGINIAASAQSETLSLRTLSSQTPDNLTVQASGGLVLFSGKTFITGATNFNNGGIGIFKSADTQTLSFRTLSSTSSNLLIIGNGDGMITFTPRNKFSGAFGSMITQNASVVNTVYIMSAETTEHSVGITVVDKTKFTIISAGTYNIQFSAQLEKTGNGSCEVDIWFRKNGNNISRSNSQIFMAKNSNDKLIASWNYVDIFTGNTDYFEIAWSSTSNDVRMLSATGLTSPTRPDVPSLIVTMFEV